MLREHVAKKFEGAVSLFDFPLEVRRYTDLESLKRQLESIPEQGGCRIVQRCGVDAL